MRQVDNSDHCALPLERRAYRSLLGFVSSQIDRASDIAALLRSDIPLSQEFRRELADAFEGKGSFGTSISIKGSAKTSKLIDATLLRRKDLEIGRWICEKQNSGHKLVDAINDACDNFLVGHESAKKSLAYFKKFQIFADEFYPTYSTSNDPENHFIKIDVLEIHKNIQK